MYTHLLSVMAILYVRVRSGAFEPCSSETFKQTSQTSRTMGRTLALIHSDSHLSVVVRACYQFNHKW